jgi:ribosomal protein L7/L12
MSNRLQNFARAIAALQISDLEKFSDDDITLLRQISRDIQSDTQETAQDGDSFTGAMIHDRGFKYDLASGELELLRNGFKLNAIRAVRERTGKGLAEAKIQVETAIAQGAPYTTRASYQE